MHPSDAWLQEQLGVPSDPHFVENWFKEHSNSGGKAANPRKTMTNAEKAAWKAAKLKKKAEKEEARLKKKAEKEEARLKKPKREPDICGKAISEGHIKKIELTGGWQQFVCAVCNYTSPTCLGAYSHMLKKHGDPFKGTPPWRKGKGQPPVY